MFHKVLVPLNGSIEAEGVLPWVRQLVANAHPRVYLLRVIRGSDGFGLDEGVVEQASAARGYLDRVAQHLGLDADVVSLVREGDARLEIAGVARQYAVDLIAMSTHDDSDPTGSRGAVPGSVVRMAGVPVVLVGIAAAGHASPAAVMGQAGAVPEVWAQKGLSANGAL